MKYGYLYQGQWYRWQKKRRGRSNLGLPRTAMVTFIQNHDQVANSARGQRVAGTKCARCFQGDHRAYAARSGNSDALSRPGVCRIAPFLYFADHKPELAQLIRVGRVEFLEQWRSLQLPEMQKCLIDPCSEETFQRSKLDFAEVEKHAEQYALHQDLLRLRRKDPVLSRQGEDGIDGAVLSESAFLLRYFSPDFQHDRLLVINLGADLEMNPSPEPLLAPPNGTHWKELWSSDDARYGGCGTAPLDSSENWRIPGHAAVVLCPLR